jgi:D-alanyl-D-alanine carboxypeptidase
LACGAPDTLETRMSDLKTSLDAGRVSKDQVLEAENATVPWYPASVTKLMTAYVTLQAVKDGKLTRDTLLTVSPVAASQSPSKMSTTR